MPDKDPLNISGQVVAGKYRIEHLAGEGGFAVVYVAEHTIWKQPVAVKFFSGLSQAPAEYRWIRLSSATFFPQPRRIANVR
jgi:hypothetical protein